MLRIARALVLVCAAASVGLGAQSGDGRPASGPVKGSAEVTVVVSTDEQDSKPLRRVSVTIQAGELDVPNIGVTDDAGRVTFRNLAAGNYLLTAARAGYVRTFYGSKLPGRGPGVAVTVLDGQKAAAVRIRMLRGGVLTGTVRTASGRPAQNQQVQAIMVRSAGGDRRAVNLESGLGSVATDDRGVYRIFGLAPGDYIVLVPSTAFGSEELRPMTSGEIRWADSAVAGGATAAPPTGLAPAPAPAPSVAYAPVYFPGTATVSDAAVITLGPSEERAGVDFALRLVPTAQMSGRVLDAEGRPQSGAQVSLRPLRTDGLDLFSSIFNVSARTGADGTFTLRGVKPGGYTMSTRATPRTGQDGGAGAPNPNTMVQAAISPFGGMGPGATHWAQEEVSVQGRDLTDFVLTLRPGMTVSGRIVYEATTKTPPTDLSTVGLMLMPASIGTSVNDMIGSLIGGAGTSPLKIEADGRFTVGGLAPGRYRINTLFAMMPMAGVPNASLTGGWSLKGVMAGGRDIADAPLEIGPGVDVSNVVVTFTDQPTELSGTVMDGAGRATADFPIIVFSTDRLYWTLGSRRVQTGRPSSDGKYRIVGLPAGEYFVCAVTAVDRTEVYDPAFLNQLTGVAFKITIKDGEKRTQDLKLGGG